MLAQKTTKNQITLPKKVVDRFTGVEYFEVSTDGTSITLRPLQRSRADEVRARLSAVPRPGPKWESRLSHQR